jgi:putative tryptophan/tyrosine transport system substrate-binding protein
MFERLPSSGLGAIAVRRRDFIGAVAGSAVAWPLTVLAQTAERARLIGMLNILGPDDPEAQIRLTIFQQALQQLGWDIGRDLKIENRQVGGDIDRLHRYAAELVALAPDVIVSIGSVSVGALQQATHTVPIVFVNVPDPVGAGFVPNMAHPGGNTTGFSNFEYSMSGKWAELLKQTAPQITRALVLRDPSSAAGIGQFASVRSVAQSLDVELTPLDVRDKAEIERGIAAFARAGDGGVIVTAGGTAAHRKLIIDLVARYKLPTVYPYRYYAVDGGLIVYGPNTHEPVRRAAGYVDRILKGEKPGDMPVQAPTKYDLIVNLKTAKALGLTMPPSILARADEVIE